MSNRAAVAVGRVTASPLTGAGGSTILLRHRTVEVSQPPVTVLGHCYAGQAKRFALTDRPSLRIIESHRSDRCEDKNV